MTALFGDTPQMSPQMLNTKLLYINEGPARDKNVTLTVINTELLHWRLDMETVIAYMIHALSGYTPSGEGGVGGGVSCR